MKESEGLPVGVTVFERGWLSANNILMAGPQGTALVDSGYCTHADQTVALVKRALGGSGLDLLLNTHLHSDHCGGNAALQAAFPAAKTLIPPGLVEHVRNWDPIELSYEPTGQQCPRFHMDGLLRPGSEIMLGGLRWQIHGAPGHDQHSVILFEPASRTLISADALWENGFGVVFQELEGEHAFDEVGATLDLIESLNPATVIPGHGRVFFDASSALAVARRRLEAYQANPTRHAAHASKVLVKFKLLELQEVTKAELMSWALGTPYFQMVFARYFADQQFGSWLDSLLEDLARSGAARVSNDSVANA